MQYETSCCVASNRVVLTCDDTYARMRKSNTTIFLYKLKGGISVLFFVKKNNSKTSE